jgi:hypothetical protein
MPPIPSWLDGRDDIRKSLSERVFASGRLPPEASGQLAFGCDQGPSIQRGAPAAAQSSCEQEEDVSRQVPL